MTGSPTGRPHRLPPPDKRSCLTRTRRIKLVVYFLSVSPLILVGMLAVVMIGGVADGWRIGRILAGRLLR